MIWRTRALFPVLDALAQGIGPTGAGRRLAILGVGRVTNVDTGAILAILFIFAILISSTAWQAFAIYLLSASMVTLALSLTDNSNWFARLTGFLKNTIHSPFEMTSFWEGSLFRANICCHRKFHQNRRQTARSLGNFLCTLKDSKAVDFPGE